MTGLTPAMGYADNEDLRQFMVRWGLNRDTAAFLFRVTPSQIHGWQRGKWSIKPAVRRLLEILLHLEQESPAMLRSYIGEVRKQALIARFRTDDDNRASARIRRRMQDLM